MGDGPEKPPHKGPHAAHGRPDPWRGNQRMPHGRPNDNFLPNNFQERRMNHYPDSLDQQLEIASRNNRMFMRMFANRISGKEQTEVIPPLFKEAALLIKHDDFSEKEKLSLTYGMAHYTGCLV